MTDVRLCDVVEGEAAAFMYRWPWADRRGADGKPVPGDEGVCSWRGRALLEQKAKSLKTECSFTQLTDVEAPPVPRGERQQLIAAKLAAEGEAEDALRRLGMLSTTNDELREEIKSLRQTSDANKKAKEAAEKRVTEANKQIARLESEKGALAEELSKANVLLEKK